MEKMMKTKVVDLEEIYNFIVDKGFVSVWNHQLVNLVDCASRLGWCA